jgi:hypothetical protein
MRREMLSYKDFSLYQNRRKSKWKNDGFRSIYESVIPKEVLVALDDWKNSNNKDCVLIGGLALSYYIRPRYTEDIDLIFLTEDDIPETVYKFRRNRKHSFEHIKTGVEVEVITPLHINKKQSLFENIFETSIESDGIKVASPLGLIALKLFRSKVNDRDKLDIIELLKYCYENKIDTDISIFDLTDEEIQIFNDINNGIDFESISENMYILEYNSYFNKNVKTIKIENDKYDIYVFEEKYGEPRFHFGRKIEKNRKYNDFQFSISLTRPIENGHIRVLESSTGYKSFNGFENDRDYLSKWIDENLDTLKSSWNKINDRKI